jgi:hypothetical protein
MQVEECGRSAVVEVKWGNEEWEMGNGSCGMWDTVETWGRRSLLQ